MFNGITFNQGFIKKIAKRDKGINIFVKSALRLNAKDIGVSIACDGVCLTLISFKKKGIKLIKSNLLKNGNFDFKLILKKIYNHGCRNLLVEGGNDLTQSFIKKRLFNHFYLFKSRKNLSKLVAYKDFNCFKDLSHKYKSKNKINTNFGKDLITLYNK